VIVLVLGGTRSGKSEVAERVAGRLGGDVTYIATGTASDPAMAARIEAHRDRRPLSWATVEAGADLVPVLRARRGTVLLDSLGTWVASAPGFAVDVGTLCAALQSRRAHTVVVSEEVGLSVHPTTAAGRDFADAVGAVNRAVAEVADKVLFVVAGRVLRLDDVDAVLGERGADA
jgi:nicotinate-nucleotide--dimethylbenzimidazole phosphoribosyltransferase